MATPANAIINDQQLPLFPAPKVIVPKAIHAGTDWVGQPYLYMDQSLIALRTKLGQGLLVDSTFGTTVSGPLSLFASLEDMHVGGGYWTFNPVQLESIGSSSALPIPLLVNSTPRIISAAQTVSNSASSLKAADPTIPNS